MRLTIDKTGRFETGGEPMVALRYEQEREMSTLWQDVRYGLRMLARSRGYTAVMVLTLALGIGATTAIFSMVRGVLLRPLAYPQSQRLVFVGESVSQVAERIPVLPVCARHFLEWRQRCSSFESLSRSLKADMTMTGAGEPERLEALEVSANLFGTLRVSPALGWLFTAEDEEGAGRVVVISDGWWRRKFGAAPSALGESITLDGKAYTIVGVLSEAFRFPNVNPWATAALETSARPAVFVPKVFTAQERNELMQSFRFSVVGRLKEGVTREQATAELNVIEAQIGEMAGAKDWELRAIVEPLKEVLVQDSRRGLLETISKPDQRLKAIRRIPWKGIANGEKKTNFQRVANDLACTGSIVGTHRTGVERTGSAGENRTPSDRPAPRAGWDHLSSAHQLPMECPAEGIRGRQLGASDLSTLDE
jgi:hypothetical protein